MAREKPDLEKKQVLPGPRPVLADALEQLDRWRNEIESDLKQGFSALTEEETLVQKALAESQRQLKALALVRQDLEEQQERLEREQQRRAWEAVQRSMTADRQMIQERASLLYRANQEKRARILAELESSAYGTAFHAALQGAGSSHGSSRTGLPDALRPMMLALEIPARVGVSRCSVAVIASTEPAEGDVQVLLLLTPVPYSVWGAWNSRVDPVPDLGFQLAWRILGALYQLLGRISAQDAPVRFLEIHGNLGIQVWLGDHAMPEDFREQTMEAIQGVHADAPELEAAGVGVYGFWLKPELVGLETE